MVFDWDFAVFVVALSIAAFSPGPGLAAIVATVIAEGGRNAIWFCAGMIVGDLVWLSLSISGLALITEQNPFVFVSIKWAGVAYLIYLALKTWRALPGTEKTIKHHRERSIATNIRC